MVPLKFGTKRDLAVKFELDLSHKNSGTLQNAFAKYRLLQDDFLIFQSFMWIYILVCLCFTELIWHTT